MSTGRDINLTDIGIGYTLGTGRLFCDMAELQNFAESILGRPVYTHEFGTEELWATLRIAYELEAGVIA